MEVKRDARVLHHIYAYCNEIAETVERFGNSFQIFAADAIYRNAIALPVMQIGELTTHLSADFKAEYTDVPWNQMKALRNVVAHHYGKIDAESLWETVVEDIPALKQYCNEILSDAAFSQQDDMEAENEMHISL